YHYSIKEINLHISNNITEWDIDGLQWLEDLKRNKIKINFIVEGDVEYKDNQEKLSVYLLSHNYILKIGKNHTYLEYPVQLSVSLNNNRNIGYISKENYSSLDIKSLMEVREKVYKIDDVVIPEYEFLLLPQINSGN